MVRHYHGLLTMETFVVKICISGFVFIDVFSLGMTKLIIDKVSDTILNNGQIVN